MASQFSPLRGGWDLILFPFYRTAKENGSLHLEASTRSQVFWTPAGASGRSSRARPLLLPLAVVPVHSVNLYLVPRDKS